MAREIPADACKHNNEKILYGDDDAYTHTAIQCVDCGSVRLCGVVKGEPDHTHEFGL